MTDTTSGKGYNVNNSNPIDDFSSFGDYSKVNIIDYNFTNNYFVFIQSIANQGTKIQKYNFENEELEILKDLSNDFFVGRFSDGDKYIGLNDINFYFYHKIPFVGYLANNLVYVKSDLNKWYVDSDLVFSDGFVYENNDNFTSTGSIEDIQDLANNELLNGIKDLFNISLPDTPDLSINLPVPKLTNTFSIGFEEKPATLTPIYDPLNKNDIQKSELSSKFFSFILALFYISVRVLVIFGILYSFKLYHNLVNKVSLYLFGFNGQNSSGNFVSLSLYLAYLIIVFGTFLVLFTSVLGFLPVIQIITKFITVFFSFIVVSFFDYSIFSNTVNVFFGLIIGGLITYLLYLLTLKFGRLN